MKTKTLKWIKIKIQSNLQQQQKKRIELITFLSKEREKNHKISFQQIKSKLEY